MDTLLFILAVSALITSIVGWLWIVIAAFNDGDSYWGAGCLIISPLCLVYGWMNFGELKIPFFLVVGGVIVRIAIVAIVSAMR